MYLNHMYMCIHTNLEVVSVKGQRTTDQCVEYHSQTPDIHLWAIILLTLEQLWGSIGRTATECVQFAARCKFIAESKIGYLDIHVGI